MLAAGGRGRDLSLLAACWRSLGALKGAQTVSKFQGRRLRKRQGREAPPVRLRGQAAPGAAPGEIEDYAIEARHAFSSTQEARLPPLHLADTVRLAEQVQSKQARVNASWCALTARLLWPDRRFGVGYSTPLTAAAAHPQETGEKSQHSRYRKAALPAAAGACREGRCAACGACARARALGGARRARAGCKQQTKCCPSSFKADRCSLQISTCVPDLDLISDLKRA